jgi:hypothetical protein
VDRQQAGGNARILAGDHIRGAEQVQGAKRHVAGVANRSGDEVKPRGRPRRPVRRVGLGR